MEKILAHKVIFEGVEHRLAVLEITDDGRHASVRPFTGEEAGTAFVNGAIEACRDANGLYRVTKLKMAN